MKSMEQCGNQLVSYEGVADVYMEANAGKSGFRGYFEAAQFPSGRVTINVVSTNPTLRTGRLSSNDPSIELSFQGESVNGWTIACSGHNDFSPFNWMTATMTRNPVERSFRPQYLVTRRKAASEAGYNKTQFLVCNVLWHQSSNEEPEPIELKALNYSISIHPVDDYRDVAPGIINTHGIAPTALITIETSGASPEPIESFKNLMDDLVYVLRLVTGNAVAWYYGEAIDERTETPVERIHQQAYTRPYSNRLSFRPLWKGYQSLVPKVDLQALTEAFFTQSKNLLDKNTLTALIDQFTNTCDETSYLEMQGLLTSALTELLATKLAYKQGTSETIPKDEYDTEKLPLLEEAINNTDWSNIAKEHLNNQMKGNYRASFRQKLKSLNQSLQLDLKSRDIERIVATRNALVHEGTFRSTSGDADELDDCCFSTWVNFRALCRLLGYEGELPTFHAGRVLEV